MTSPAAPLTACVIIDYQNIHFTARDVFAPPSLPPEDCLIHPLLFAEQVLSTRAKRQLDPRQAAAQLTSVKVFRGQPSNAHQPALYAITQKQRSEWTRDRRVAVEFRTLRYPGGWPRVAAREKGVDVLVALHLVRCALEATHDIVILATHDTDQEPALEMAVADGKNKVETAGWKTARILRPGGKRLWHTALSAAEFVASRDRKDYS